MPYVSQASGGEGPKMINQYFNVYALRRVRRAGYATADLLAIFLHYLSTLCSCLCFLFLLSFFLLKYCLKWQKQLVNVFMWTSYMQIV